MHKALSFITNTMQKQQREDEILTDVICIIFLEQGVGKSRKLKVFKYHIDPNSSTASFLQHLFILPSKPENLDAASSS